MGLCITNVFPQAKLPTDGIIQNPLQCLQNIMQKFSEKRRKGDWLVHQHNVLIHNTLSV
jgi:hypothetical protein